MKYWIIIESWNLMESFMTESLSPYNFYEQRAFGHNLKRNFSEKGESQTDLLLYKKEPQADYAIQIDDSLVDKSLFSEIKGEKSLWCYPRTIYYCKGKVRFRFKSKEVLDSFVAESKIIIEVKTIEKYLQAFYVQEEHNISENKIKKDSGSFPFNENQYIKFDNLYNSIKGGIIAFACGICSKKNENEQSLIILLNNLKNSVGGLNSEIMINESSLPDFKPYKESFQSAKIKLISYGKYTQTFEVLKNIFEDIINVSTLRYNELRKRYTPEFKLEQARLKAEERECMNRKAELENDHNIREYQQELRDIKELEVINGRKENKKRKYFPKGSSEYMRKKELKELIDDFERSNSKYSILCAKLKEIQEHIDDKSSKYDATISSLFTRFSDNINNFISKVKNDKSNMSQSLDFSRITLQGETLRVHVDGVDDAENVYYNLLIDYLIAHPNGKQGTISDNTILDIIVETSRIFKNDESSSTEVGTLIIESIRTFWEYKKNRTDSFSIPKETRLLQAIMSFFIKFRGFDQIERFMMNKSYELKEYAFLLCGILMGYAAIPKIFTMSLYGKDYTEQESDVEEFLSTLRDELTKITNQ